MTPALPEPVGRRHDLDALRAVAMLLGIALHVALSFVPGIWMVQDSRENIGFALLISSVHGFRMPLFFLISGFFTAMLWRKRGLGALIKQRTKRILVPCLVGLVTIVPLTWASLIVVSLGQEKKGADALGDHWSAAAAGNVAAVERHLSAGADVNALHPVLGTSALTMAALHRRVEVMNLLLAKGADGNLANRDGSTPLHAAALLGRADAVKLLLDEGADFQIRNHHGQTAQETMLTAWGKTRFMASVLQVWPGRKEVMEGRIRAEEHFVAKGAPKVMAGPAAPRSHELLNLLMLVPFFHHLWFLWFLVWLVAGFAIYARIVDHMGRQSVLPAWLVSSRMRYFWLIPLTLIPQSFMGGLLTAFGPDTSIGLIPLPHVLAYYAVFFGFGALYYDHQSESIGSGWRWTLPLMLFVVFPLGLEFTLGSFGFRQHLVSPSWYRPIANVLQVSYAWGMSFACIGMFRSVFHGESRIWRYVSDSSYWLYVVHLPVVVFVQYWVKDWPIPAIPKFLLMTALITGSLLLSYQYMVRYTWIGRMLNGPREKPKTTPVTGEAPLAP